jgi:hypothetical protein
MPHAAEIERMPENVEYKGMTKTVDNERIPEAG